MLPAADPQDAQMLRFLGAEAGDTSKNVRCGDKKPRHASIPP